MAREHGRPNGAPLLAHSLVKGRLRQSWEELYSASHDERFAPESRQELLGPDPRFGSDLSQSNEPRRARVEFTDFLAPAGGPCDRVRYRIAVDADRGAADEHMLLLQESPFLSGQEVVFVGNAFLHVADAASAAEVGRLIETGLRWTLVLGAEHTIGFGRLLEATVGEPLAVPGQTPMLDIGGLTDHPWLDLVLTPLAPFCLAEHRREDNLFISRDEIPGAAIKGCVAEALKRLGELPSGSNGAHGALAAHFDDLVFAHAFPVARGVSRRPVVIPESIVKTSDGWHDLALLGVPGLVNGEAPEFQVDWKASADIKAAFGWSKPPDRELRVRTAIDRARHRAADEMLFAQERVVPTGHEWLARVDFCHVPESERAETARQLCQVLRQGLFGLGKTKAVAKVEVLPPGSLSAGCGGESRQDGLWVLTLQTPTLLGWPEDFAEDDPRHGAEYHLAWSALSEGNLRLRHFYARQFMAGGGYLRHRFQKGRPYNPWLLTAPGSVFVLETVGDSVTVAEMITGWQRGGLPLPQWAKSAWGLSGERARDWRLCPYLPENGYGEIAVNLSCHTEKKPTRFNSLIS